MDQGIPPASLFEQFVQSISCNVRVSVGCVFVPSNGIRNGVEWRPLVKERTAKIAKLGAPDFCVMVEQCFGFFLQRLVFFS